MQCHTRQSDLCRAPSSSHCKINIDFAARRIIYLHYRKKTLNEICRIFEKKICWYKSLEILNLGNIRVSIPPQTFAPKQVCVIMMIGDLEMLPTMLVSANPSYSVQLS